MAKRLFLYFTVFLLFTGCKKSVNNTDNDFIPIRSVNFQVDLNNPLYQKLNNKLGYVYIDNEGARGIILVHDANDQFLALERNCPFKPSTGCAQVTVEKNGINIRCGSYSGNDFNDCCGSQFNLSGELLSGPSRYSLKQYTVSQSGSILYINN